MSLSRKIGNIGSILDSASTGTFMSKAASDAAFESISYSSLSGTPTTLDSANVTAIIDSAYVQARQTLGSAALDSAAITSIIDSNYVQARTTTVSSGFVDYEYTATSGQTTFQDSDLNSNILSYTADGIMVFYNGVLLRDSSDYTASDGSSVVLASGADSGSTVSISKWTIPSAGGAGGAVWYGDRALVHTYSSIIQLEYYDITTTGNAANFGGGITAQRYAAACSNGTYGCIMGGSVGSTQLNEIEYVTISTTGNASDFGDLTQQVTVVPAGTGDGTYGIRFGGTVGSPAVNNIDYFTMASPSNAVDFGDLTAATTWTAACSDGTYGVRLGGYNNTTTMDYVTFASPGNASDFGDLLYRYSERGAGGQDENGRGIKAAGEYDGENQIQYIQIDTPGNAIDFGDLTSGRGRLSSSCNATRATFAGGDTTNIIDYIDVQTIGNATDFGDLLGSYYGNTGTAGSPS